MNREWEDIQQRTFTRWVNAQVKKKGIQISDICKDFEDGVTLIVLYETISDTSLGKYTKPPFRGLNGGRIYKLENLSIVIAEINKFVSQVGIKVQFSAQQIHDGDKRSILGLVWCLIHKFAIADISEESMHARDGLLLWCKKKTEGYKHVNIQNFDRSWKNGMGFCALIHKHHPNLIDYDSLDPNDAMKNLQLAFDVAEKELDIPCLLDAKDIVDSDRPDDKSIMAYVAYYWKKFASSGKQQKSANMISRLGKKQAEYQQIITDYERRAKALIGWTNESNQKLSDTSNFGNSLAKVVKTNEGFKVFKNDQKPKQNEEKGDLEITLKNLRSKQKNDGLQVYEPPKELATEAINGHWDELSKTQEVYEKAIKEAILKMKYLERLVARFRSKVKQLQAWQNSKKTNELAEDIEKLEAIAAVQGKIKIMETFDEELSGEKKNLEQIMKVGQEVINEAHEASESITSDKSTTENGFAEVESAAQEFKTKLDELLKRKQLIEAKCIEIANLVQQFSTLLENASNSLVEPVSSTDVAEVEKKLADNEKIIHSHGENNSVLEKISSLAAEITELGGNPNLYTSMPVEECSTAFTTVGTELGVRKGELEKELELQKAYLEMLKQWEHTCEADHKWCEEQKQALEQKVDGSFGAQLKALEENFASITKDSESKLGETKAVFDKLVEADIATRVTTSFQTVTVSHDGIENSKKKLALEFQTKIKQVDRALESVKQRLGKLAELQNAKKTYFAGIVDKVNTIVAIQEEIKSTQDYPSGAFKTLEDSFNEAKKLVDFIISTKFEGSDDVSKTLASAQEGNDALLADAKETEGKLNEKLKAKQAIDDLCKQISKLTQSLNHYIEKVHGKLDEPIEASSVEEVDTLIANHDSLDKEYAEKKSELDQIEALTAQVKEANEDPNRYSAMDLETITDKYNSVPESSKEKKIKLEAEKERQLGHVKLLEQWEAAAKADHEWCEAQKELLEKQGEGSLAAQLSHLNESHDGISKESETKRSTITELHSELVGLEIVMRVATTLQNVTLSHTNISNVHKKKALELETKIKALEKTIENFKNRIAKISQVQETKTKYFDGIVSKVTTIAAIQGEIKNVAEFKTQYKGLEDTFAEAKKMGDSIIATKHETSEEIASHLATAQTGNEALLKSSVETGEKLQNLLSQKQAIEELCIKISKSVQNLNIFVENANGQIEEPITVSSVKDAHDLIVNFDALEKEYAEKKSTLSEVASLCAQVTEAHENPEVYAPMTLAQITTKFDGLADGFRIKKGQLEKEKLIQEQNETLLKAFADAFGNYSKFVSTSTSEIEKELSGELEEQLKVLRELGAKITPESKNGLKKLNELFAQIEQADIGEQAPVTLQEVAVLDAQLAKVLSKRIETIEANILSKKQSNISESQLKDFRDTFKFFDKEKSGSLNKIQFKAACASLGEDIPDEKLEATFAHYDTDKDGKISFDEFIAFISSVAKEGAGKDDLLGAFRDLTKGEKYISESAIRSNFDKEQAEYFLKVLPKVEGGYDYEAYIESTYAK